MKNKMCNAIRIFFSVMSIPFNAISTARIYLIYIAVFIGLVIFSFILEDIRFTIMILLLLSGGGGMVFYILYKKENKNMENEQYLTITDARPKPVAVVFGCLIFVIYCCISSLVFVLFPHWFDNIREYSSTLGSIINIAILLFFCLGFIVLIRILIKPTILMKISDEGVFIPNGLRFKNKTSMFIAWEEIESIKRNSMFLCIYLKNPDLHSIGNLADFISNKLTGTNINIPNGFFNINAGKIENLIRNKWSKYEKK